MDVGPGERGGAGRGGSITPPAPSLDRAQCAHWHPVLQSSHWKVQDKTCMCQFITLWFLKMMLIKHVLIKHVLAKSDCEAV